MITQADAPIQLANAREAIGQLVELLRPACERIEIAGSVRRGKLEVHDAEVVAIATPDLLPLTDTLVEYGKVQYALYGEKKSKRWGQSYRGMLFQGIKCELFLTHADSWGYQYWLRTGPATANTYIMQWLNWNKVNAPIRFRDGYGWYAAQWYQTGKGWEAADKRKLRIASEEDLFAVLGMPYIPPNERTEAVYKRLTNVRNFKWPDYAPYFAAEPEQMRLIGAVPVHRYFDASDLDEKEKEKADRITAERAYNRQLHAVPVEELKRRPQWYLK